jgi:hypothetical protein
MLHLLRSRGKDGGSTKGERGSLRLNSHILVKFLKRLRTEPRPHILDLGPLSGANIEFFAELGCRVQVEDLVSVAEIAPRPTPPPRPKASPSPRPPQDRAAETGQPDAGAPVVSPARPGARPSRRIVLPTRTFPTPELSRERGRHGSRPVMSLPGQGGLRRKWHTRLPVKVNFAESTFDAIIAWDVFNYYDPESVRVMAAEVRRVLKPGGMVLAYFDTCRAEEPVVPWRYRIVNDKQVSCDAMPGRLMLRQVYQNRDIEKMFTGLRIVDLYFLKNSMREVLMEKKASTQVAPKVRPPSKTPKPRFTIE